MHSAEIIGNVHHYESDHIQKNKISSAYGSESRIMNIHLRNILAEYFRAGKLLGSRDVYEGIVHFRELLVPFLETNHDVK